MSASQSPARILIVEDSLGIARALQRALGLYQDGGFQVRTCESGEIALKWMIENPFDLLVTDLRLPGIDGLDLLERSRRISPEMRAILITAFGSPEVEARAQELSNGYLTKPFHLQDLIRMVERVLREPVPLQSPDNPLAAIRRNDDQNRVEKKRKSAHLIILACDLDGTLTGVDQSVSPKTWETLYYAKMAGMVLILVTGRTLDHVAAEFQFAELCEAIVAENGAVVYYPRRDEVSLPFGRLDPAFLKRVESMGVRLERGLAIASTWIPQDEGVLKALREIRSGAVVEYNRDAVMILPAGATKGTGLLIALQELGYSPHNVVACGNAENDRSLFEVVELGVAVANAQPAARLAADAVLPLENGAGVELLIKEILSGRVPNRRQRASRRLSLGERMSGTPVYLDPFALLENNLGIFGSSGSGKSWLAGLLAEEMLKQKYQVCIIDPEGDYRGLGASPQTLLFGGPSTPLPPVSDMLNISEWNTLSLVLDLSMYGMEERTAYIAEFLRALRGLRSRRGRPHWFLVDEIQSFCPLGGGLLTDLFLESMQLGGFSVISYRLSQIDPALLTGLDHLLVTRLNLREELDALEGQLARNEGGMAALDELRFLPKGQAYLCLDPNKRWGMPGGVIKFRVGQRTIPHVRHLHKYLRAPMPEPKRFYFQEQEGRVVGKTAASLWEFLEALREVPSASLHYHLKRGDFEHWLREVLHDEELARRVHKVADHKLQGEALRQALLEVVIGRYEELEAYL